jgi:hypothetical protein
MPLKSKAMKRYDEERQVQFSPVEKTIRRNRGLLQLVSEESLIRNMYKSAYFEEYEKAAVYRDELIRRGKLAMPA